MKKLLFLLFIPLFSCSSNSHQTPGVEVLLPAVPSLTPDQLKDQLKQTEKSHPLKYLKMYGDPVLTPTKKQVKHSTWFRNAQYEDDGVLIDGSIINTAILAKFKDALIAIKYYSSTGSLISTQNSRLYQFYSPGDTVLFQLHLYPPPDFVNFSASIQKAKSAN